MSVPAWTLLVAAVLPLITLWLGNRLTTSRERGAWLADNMLRTFSHYQDTSAKVRKNIYAPVADPEADRLELELVSLTQQVVILCGPRDELSKALKDLTARILFLRHEHITGEPPYPGLKNETRDHNLQLEEIKYRVESVTELMHSRLDRDEKQFLPLRVGKRGTSSSGTDREARSGQ